MKFTSFVKKEEERMWNWNEKTTRNIVSFIYCTRLKKLPIV